MPVTPIHDLLYNVLDGTTAIKADLTAADIQIGAIELKNAITDDRAKVATTATVAEGDVVLGVQAPVLGATTGAAVVTDAAGTVQQFLRGLVTLIAARIPGLGQALMAVSVPVTVASNQSEIPVSAGTGLSTAALALEAGGNLATVAGDTTSLDTKVPADPAREGGNLATIAGDTTSLDGKMPALGSALAAASLPVTLATDDASICVEATLTDTLNLSADDTSTVLTLDNHNYVDVQVIGTLDTHIGTLAVETTVDGTNWTAEALTNPLTGAIAASIAVASGAAIDERILLGPLACTAVRVFYTWSANGIGQTATVTMRARR